MVENYVGNGGNMLMEWRELVADDSIAQTLYSLVHDGVNQNKVAFQKAVLCGRGSNTTLPTQRCQ